MLSTTNWFSLALQLRGSIIPQVLPRTLFCGIFGEGIWFLYKQGFAVSFPVLSSLVPSIVLGLLLVFRTNTAYERFWEGRKAWGTVVNTVRNLARQIWVAIPENEPQDRDHKQGALDLLVAFAVATKLHLRRRGADQELADLVSSSRLMILQKLSNPPLEIAFWIGSYLQNQFNQGRLGEYQLTAMQRHLDILVESLGACERIQRTPIPLAYAIHLKQLLLIFCLALPFQMVDQTQWVTGLVVAAISFTLLGIEAIALEIENPFGSDANDLPLDEICLNLARNLQEIALGLRE